MSAIINCALLLALVSIASGYESFQKQIPNGDRVPDPCDKTLIWKGVGHLDRNGGGDRNLFGQAFAQAGYKWTTALCLADSDGDTMSNGFELGDPDCVWKPGMTPTTVAFFHPGFKGCPLGK